MNFTGSVIADVFHVGQFSQYKDLPVFLQIKGKNIVLILNQCDSFPSRLKRQINMFFACQCRAVVFLVISIFIGQQGSDNSQRRIINVFFRHFAFTYGLDQFVTKKYGTAHFHILTAVHSLYRVGNTKSKITHNKTIKIPLFFKDFI